MAVKRISINWVAKLNDSKDLPKYGVSGDGKFSKKFRQGRFVIPAPLEVDALMRKVPKGKLTTINELHAALSKKHKTDFNGDGRPDFVVTNGDNGEYPSPPKSYHGIRVYLNRGGMKYEKSLFLPLNGAFRALARDYDADGDTDIAAVSYFPNYNKSPRESFVYFENKDGKYTANTFRTCISGRWLTMDAGDVDGDGDIDLALGNYS